MNSLYDFQKAIDPETSKEVLLSLMNTKENSIKIALCTQKKLFVSDYPKDWHSLPYFSVILSSKKNSFEDGLFKASELLNKDQISCLFSLFLNNETLCNFFLRKDFVYFEIYVNSLFKKSLEKESILNQYEDIIKEENPQKYLLKTLLKKEDYLAIIDQKRFPAWVLDEITKSIIKKSSTGNIPVDLKNFVNDYLINNRNLSVESAISLYKAFPDFCNYGKAFKIKHIIALDFFKKSDNIFSLKYNKKIKEKTFYAFLDIIRKENNGIKKKEMAETLIQNPSCPEPILKAILLSSQMGIDDNSIKQINEKLITPSTLPLILLKTSESSLPHFYLRKDLPEIYLRKQKRWLKSERLLKTQASLVPLEEIKLIDQLLDLINEKLSKSSSSKNKIASIF